MADSEVKFDKEKFFAAVIPAVARATVDNVIEGKVKTLEGAKKVIAKTINRQTETVFQLVAAQIKEGMVVNPTTLIQNELAQGEDWKRLSTEYAQRKGNETYFVGPSDYRSRKAQGKRKLSRSSITKRANGRLRKWLERQDGLKYLGAVSETDIIAKPKVTNRRQVTGTKSVKGKVEKYYLASLTFSFPVFPLIGGRQGINPARFTSTKVWQSLSALGFGSQKVPREGRPSKSDLATYANLLGRFNPAGSRAAFPYRRMIEPIMRYYAKRRIPAAVERALQGKRSLLPIFTPDI